MIHSVPVLFKGSGFYCTDHGRGLSNNPGRKDDVAETKSETDKEAKAETKPKGSD